jgi:hypothetical protein
MSRLDMLFVTSELSAGLMSSELNWAFDDSDHSLLKANIKLSVNFVKGPGLFRVNADLLDDNATLLTVKQEIERLIEQISNNLNPHTKMDYIKMSIRSVMAEMSGKIKRNTNQEHEAIIEQINTLMAMKEKLERGEIDNARLLADINITLTKLDSKHMVFLDQLAKKLCAKAQVKWYEEGERSNKYFMNIIKKCSEQKLITKLKKGNDALTTQPEIMEHVTEFYCNLNDIKETNDNYDNLLSDLPTLSNYERMLLDGEITLDELRKVLEGCRDSAP